MTRPKILILILVIIGIIAASLVFTSGRNLLKEPSSHAPDYSWIVGRLEYSQIEGGFWVIRYENQTDKFGGKFVLGNDSRLANFKSGDLVKITGRISDEQVSFYQSGTLYDLESIDFYR